MGVCGRLTWQASQDEAAGYLLDGFDPPLLLDSVLPSTMMPIKCRCLIQEQRNTSEPRLPMWLCGCLTMANVVDVTVGHLVESGSKSALYVFYGLVVGRHGNGFGSR